MTAPTPELLSQEELCTRLRLSERQVRQLTRRGMPRTAPTGGRDRFGRYPWPEAFFWYLEFKSQEARTRRERYAQRGPNVVVPPPPRSRVVRDRYLLIPLSEALRWFTSSKAAKASRS